MLHPKTHLREKADTEIPEVQHIPEHPAPTEIPFIFSRLLPWPLPNGKRTALSPKVDNLEGAWSPGTSNNPFLAPRAHRDKHRRDLTGWVLAQQGTGSTRNEAIQLKREAERQQLPKPMDDLKTKWRSNPCKDPPFALTGVQP